MIIQALGLIDVLISAFFGLMIYEVAPSNLFIIFGIYLLGKGILFISSLASIIDIFAGIVLIASYFFAIPSFILMIAALLLLQKGIFSFL